MECVIVGGVRLELLITESRKKGNAKVKTEKIMYKK